MPFRTELKRPDLKGQFPCSVCRKVFCHSSSLSRHRMQAHFKSYICTQCSPNCEIASSETLRTHMTKCHSISRMFMCKCCNWAFPDKTSLHIHVQSITNSNGTDPGDVVVLARSSVEGGPLDPILTGMHLGNGDSIFDDSSQDDIGQDSPVSSLSYREAGDESDDVVGSQAPTQVNTLPHHSRARGYGAYGRDSTGSIFPRQPEVKGRPSDYSPLSSPRLEANGHTEAAKQLGNLRRVANSMNDFDKGAAAISNAFTDQLSHQLLNWLSNNPQLDSPAGPNGGITSRKGPILGSKSSLSPPLANMKLEDEANRHMITTALATLQALAATGNVLGGANDWPAALNTAQTQPQKKRAKLRVLSASRRSDGATHGSNLSVSVNEAKRTGGSAIDMSSPVLAQDMSPRVGSDAHHGRKLNSLIDNLLLTRSEAEGMHVNLSDEQALKEEADCRRNRRKARTPYQLAPQASSQFLDESTKLKKGKDLDRDIKPSLEGNETAEDALPGHSSEQPSPAVSSHSQTSGSSTNMEVADGVHKNEKCHNCEELKSQLFASRAQLELSERDLEALRRTVAELSAKFGLPDDSTNLIAE